MTLENWVLLGVVLWNVAFWGLHFAYIRQVNKANLRFDHRKALRNACSAGESSLEWHAMRCTICGNFHAGDDGDCSEY